MRKLWDNQPVIVIFAVIIAIMIVIDLDRLSFTVNVIARLTTVAAGGITLWVKLNAMADAMADAMDDD